MTVVDVKVREIIRCQLDVAHEKVVPGARFDRDLGADSLDKIELILAFEEAFCIEISDEEAEKLGTVGEVVACVERRV